MAAAWQESVEHILAIGTSFSKSSIPTLCSIISKSEEAIIHAKEEDEGFFCTLVALSAHFIGLNVTHCHTHLSSIVKACRVLLRFALTRLDSNQDSCVLTKKQLVSIIECLCRGHGCLDKTEALSFTEYLKLAPVPQMEEGSEPASAVDEKDGFLRLQTTFRDENNDLPGYRNWKGSDRLSGQSPVDVKSCFSNSNVAVLRQLGGGQLLLDLCLMLPNLAKIAGFETCTREGRYNIPLQSVSKTSADLVKMTPLSVQELSSELALVSTIMSLPILEPLTANRVDKVCLLAHGCMHAAVVIATGNFLLTGGAGPAAAIRGASSKPPFSRSLSKQAKGGASTVVTDEEAVEKCAHHIVESSLNIFSEVCSVITASSRVGGQVLQNLQMVAAHCILHGLLPTLGLTAQEAKAKESAATKFKWAQGFNVLVVNLASRGINLMSALGEELEVEGQVDVSGNDTSPPADDQFTVTWAYSAWQRFKRLMEDLPLLMLLFSQFDTLYRMASRMLIPVGAAAKSAAGPSSERSDSSRSPVSSSDEGDSEYISYSSSDEDDSLFGKLFEDIVPSAPLLSDASDQQQLGSNVGDGAAGAPGSKPFKVLPEQYVCLAVETLHFLTRYLLSSRIPEVLAYVQSAFCEAQMARLAGVVRALDEVRRAVRLAEFDALSSAVDQAVSKVLAAQLLPWKLQNALLANLGLAPHDDGPWPLVVSPRCLAILARILLGRQQEGRSSGDPAQGGPPECVRIWERLIDTLQEKALRENQDAPDLRDLNVEHLQLLVFMFHNLSRDRRQALLLRCAHAIIRVTQGPGLASSSPEGLARLLLLLDYFVHHFSTPPDELLKQIQHNLFPASSRRASMVLPHPIEEGVAGEGEEVRSLHFSCLGQEEENFSRAARNFYAEFGDGGGPPPEVLTPSPRFYDLRPASTSVEDALNLDKEACDILLRMSGDGQSYTTLYAAVLKSLTAGSECDVLYRRGEGRLGPLDAAMVRHCFGLAWRLLGSLPVSSRHFTAFARELREQSEAQTASGVPEVLLSLRLSARMNCAAANEKYAGQLKEWLAQQGMPRQEADHVVSTVSQSSGDLLNIVAMVRLHLNQIGKLYDGLSEREDVSGLPSMLSVCVLDVVLARAHVTLNSLFANMDFSRLIQTGRDLMPNVLGLISLYQKFVRRCLLLRVVQEKQRRIAKSLGASSDQPDTSAQALRMYSAVLRIGSMRLPKHSALSLAIIAGLPASVQSAVDRWGGLQLTHFPSSSSWCSKTADSAATADIDTFFDSLVTAHMAAMSSGLPFDTAPGLKHTLQSLVQLAAELVVHSPREEQSVHALLSHELKSHVVPLLVDATTDYVLESGTEILEHVVGPGDSDQFAQAIQLHVLTECHALLMEESGAGRCCVGEEVLLDCLKFLEALLERPAGRALLEQFYAGHAQLARLVLLTANKALSLAYVNRTLKFAVRILQLAEKFPQEASAQGLCACLLRVGDAEPRELEEWLTRLVIGVQEDREITGKMADNRLLLQTFATLLVKDSRHHGDHVARALLRALLPLGSKLLPQSEDELASVGSKFTDLVSTASVLAGAADGEGHVHLCKAVIGWLQTCKTQVIPDDPSKVKAREAPLVEVAGPLLAYLSELLAAVRFSAERDAPPSPAPTNASEGDLLLHDVEAEWLDYTGGDDDDSGGEESDEESLGNKLCTFTVTQKEFMNQHWYHCHTCNMNDGVGVCTICAKVCHKDHDVSYAKYGSFFCDCGAKEDGSCQALVKRVSSVGADGRGKPSSPFSAADLDDSSVEAENAKKPRPSSSSASVSGAADGVGPGPSGAANPGGGQEDGFTAAKSIEALARTIEKHKESIVTALEQSSLSATSLQLLRQLMEPATLTGSQCTAGAGAGAAIRAALEELHLAEKSVEATEQLMVPTLGSQEGAFENVRMTFSGEQGQAIRQLIGAHVLRRVAMCCLATPRGRRQHLAVSHEKGKITVLQLSALLKQADSSKRKLTLTRLATAQVPFSVLSITGNPCNEDFLAVCGLKDCHVLTFSSAGSVVDHLALHPQLETGNFIICACWLPGSQTELAVVTADFVKIYDLSADALSPVYYFVLPSGKIRDVSFVFSDDERNMLLMSSTGLIYLQPMDAASSAANGPFYLTNTVAVQHRDLQDSGGQVAGGGVSIYYSHSLQLLFFSYAQGKTFIAPWKKGQKDVQAVYPVPFKSSAGGNKSSHVALCQWREVPQHPGLLCCLTHTTGVPVVLMVKPRQILVQEIKSASSKAKTQDMVAIRHAVGSASDQQRTTMILLCEDGSLRIYMASGEHTGFWMDPGFQPTRPLSIMKPARKKKATKTRAKSTAVNFPVDFFEHCQALNDVEFGGSDILHVYNAQQAKHRLMTASMYLASTKPNGFSIEITNSNPGVVMVGLRLLVGCQSLEKAPSFVEIGGRVVQLTLSRNRWFDLPFTREESLSADKKFTLFVGQSSDPSGVTMVDSIKMYARTKEAFGWPDEVQDDLPSTPNMGVVSSVPEKDLVTCSAPMTAVDRLMVNLLETLDGCFSTFFGQEDSVRQSALDLATGLMTGPAPACVQKHAKGLLATLHPSKSSFHSHKDQAQLAQVLQYLSEVTPIVPEVAPIVPEATLVVPEETKETPKDDAQPSQQKDSVEHKDRTKDAGTILDVENFHRLVVSARSVAVTRPSNLVRYATVATQEELGRKEKTEASTENAHFAVRLMDAFWNLHSCQPAQPALAPLAAVGLRQVESIVIALVEILHAFVVTDPSQVKLAVNQYVRLLLSEDPAVSFSCSHALMRLLHPLRKHRHTDQTTPPQCSSPPGEGVGGDEDDGDEEEGEADGEGGEADGQAGSGGPREGEGAEDGRDQAAAQPSASEAEQSSQQAAGPSGGGAGPNAASQLEALLLGGAGNLDLELPQMADDEAMVELAIALSLQEQAGAPALNLQALGLAPQQAPLAMALEGANSSGASSVPGSEDEYEVPPGSAQDSSADHSAPRSPLPPEPEHVGPASESGGSAESISVEAHARGSMDGEQGGREESTSDSSHVIKDQERGEPGDQHQLHTLHLLLLESFLEHVPQLGGVGGVQAIPFMQVFLLLCASLDDTDADQEVLERVLSCCLDQLDLQHQEVKEMATRSKRHEVQLIVMRFLSVLLSRTKSSTKGAAQASSLVCRKTVSKLCSVGIVDRCLEILKCLLDHWTSAAQQDQEEPSGVGGALLKPQPPTPTPDMSPFFLRQYVKGHACDVFESYPQLLTEMVLRLPYQVKKVADTLDCGESSPAFSEQWIPYLCEYMMVQQTPFVRRQVRKLLLFLCESKDNYRQLRDLHALDAHMKAVRSESALSGVDVASAETLAISLPYDTLITLIEHLKACTEIASSRISNWQAYCIKHTSSLPFLFRSSFLFEEGVAPVMLQLLSLAICDVKPQASGSTSQKSKRDKDKDKDKDKEKGSSDSDKRSEANARSLVQLLHGHVAGPALSRFVHAFLLESNSTAVRWQAHELLYSIHKHSTSDQQESLSSMLWSLWPRLPGYGRRAAQFVDLLGYFTVKSAQTSDKLQEHCEKAVQLLKTQNEILGSHPNSNVYRMLSGFVEFDGYYLESDPCLVCNNPEVPLQNLKLSTIKGDSRFTTTCQLVKLLGSHSVSRITLRIAELKRQKMVRTINLYYNNRTVQSVVELKNKRSLWHKAKKCHLTPGQTELKVDFPLPIVACNLMIEYADFYENFQASSETLQCPRCSASVPANPGVCSNCGENVYQCHKCRSINYDERDPFLCTACGFCKYAKFDFTLSARACCAVDPIESEEDRKKAVGNINSLLERADRVYRQLVAHRPPLDTLLAKILEHGDASKMPETAGSFQVTSAGAAGPSSHSSSGGSAGVNKAIQALAQRYSIECKSTFDELSKIIQKVLASRKELLEYDSRQRDACASGRSAARAGDAPAVSGLSGPKGTSGRCYGCASAATEHCVTLLKALALLPDTRQKLVQEGLIRELIDFNLHQGTGQMRSDVRQLLCLLTKDNAEATQQLNDILIERVGEAVGGQRSNPAVVSGISREMLLLSSTMEMEDSCWEQRLRCVMQLFMMAVEGKSPLIMDSITLPCLKILTRLVKPPAPTSHRNKDRSADSLGSVHSAGQTVINVTKWVSGEPGHTHADWKRRAPQKLLGPQPVGQETREEARQRYLMEKYVRKWRMSVERQAGGALPGEGWLRQVLFTPSSRAARQIACSIVESLCHVPSRRQQMLNLLTSFLDEVSAAGENAAEFFQLYQRLTRPTYWKYHLGLQGALLQIGELITKEIEHLTFLERTTLSSDLSQGYSLKMLTELVASFLEHEAVKQKMKGRLVGSVLNGYLSLRRLIVQRTKLIDETQDLLLELLEEMTTGTEVETRAFMAICVETLKRCAVDDLRTPVFIFERLCSLIFPEENDAGEFFMTLEKDPQQEDFLQGRMQGNPYSSNEPGLGPLMRNVKNKICTDCELVALLEDDNGMELLVNNKIISLDLPVKEVYKKIWLPDGEGEPIRVVYRMRGLLGDATEEFVESLDSNQKDDVDEEEVYKMAAVLPRCGGLEEMLTRLKAVRDLSRGKQLVCVILKLLGYCVKLKDNRQYLCNPSLNALNVLLGSLNQALQMEEDASGGGGASIAAEVLGIMETILLEATKSAEPTKLLHEDNHTQLDMLLDKITSPFMRSNTSVLQAMMRIIPFLTFGDERNMRTLINHFLPFLDFDKFDRERSNEEVLFFDCFCNIASGIENNPSGFKLKDMIIENGIVGKAIDYLETQTPKQPFSKANLLELDVWKEFLARPSLPYVLRLLSGLCAGHERTQLLVGESAVPCIHRLEQVSSEEMVGSLAENLMEALRENPKVEEKATEVRRETREEKKRLAMAMRQKQLGALGMKTTDSGKIIAQPSGLLQQMEDLHEESGLACCICREGYRYHPQKVLGIYTFTKRCILEEAENKPRKTQGYCTVSHFNIVHYDCHMAAVRLARSRDEWESAALQNANTKCNGLLPVWGPQVSESAFASCLARHNSYIQECTGHMEPTYHAAVHDLRLLIQRFAYEHSFSEDTGGGGRDSNMKFVPYLVHMIIYVLNTTRQRGREEKMLKAFLDAPADKWADASYEVDGPFYVALLSLFVYSREQWNRSRLVFLKRLIVTAHARHTSPSGPASSWDSTLAAFSVYKPALIYFALVNSFQQLLKKPLKCNEGNWPQSMLDYIRNNDEALLKTADKLLGFYQQDLLPTESMAEFCDVAEILEEIQNPEGFISSVLASIPK